MLRFFNTTHVTEFAGVVAAELKKILPPEKARGTPISSEKQRVKFDKIILSVAAFSARNKLNFYQRAKFANTLKWTMKETGYEDAFIDTILGILLPEM